MRPAEAEAEIRALVHDFYGRVRDDDLLGPLFEARIGGRWDPHLEKMCDFWSSVLHATGRYRGDPVAAHARVPGLAPAHFDRWLELFDEATRATLPPHRAADVYGRAARMRLVLERNTLPTP